jgi:hypothetical protein
VVLTPLVLASVLLLPLLIYRLLHRPPSPVRKKRNGHFWFTMWALVIPVWLLTPASYLACGWGLLATFGWGHHWPASTGWRTAAQVGVAWAFLEVSSTI